MPTTLITEAWRKPLVCAAVLAAALVATLAALVHRSTTSFDSWTFRELYSHIGSTGAQTLLDLSSPGLPIGLVVLVALFAGLLRRWDLAALAVLGPSAAVVLSKWVLKPLIGRPLIIGPYAAQGGVFPSGHETAVSSTALVLLIAACQLPMRAAGRAVVAGLLALWTVLAAVGLVRNFWHYATDTIGGLCVSVVVVSALALGIDQLGSRRR